MMVSHASRTDLDNWEKLGNPAWNFDALQQYYRKSEIYNPPDEVTANELGTDIIDPSLHGNAGPIQTSFPRGQGRLDQAWGPAFKTLGLYPSQDPRKGDTLGGYSLPKFMDSKARRSYSTPAYYAPFVDRPNLVVLTNALVLNIEFENLVATGVRYSVAGQENFVRTRGEVILSAGSVNSPQILELSGIGSRDRLKALEIEIVVDNPNVGENLQVNLSYLSWVTMLTAAVGSPAGWYWLRSIRWSSNSRGVERTGSAKVGHQGMGRERSRSTCRWCNWDGIFILLLSSALKQKGARRGAGK